MRYSGRPTAALTKRPPRILKQARAAAKAGGQLDAFNSTVARLRETRRRRPTLIAILDRAKLTGDAEASRGG